MTVTMRTEYSVDNRPIEEIVALYQGPIDKFSEQENAYEHLLKYKVLTDISEGPNPMNCKRMVDEKRIQDNKYIIETRFEFEDDVYIPDIWEAGTTEEHVPYKTRNDKYHHYLKKTSILFSDS